MYSMLAVRLQACCSLGNHPKASSADVETAILWLHLLITWAHEGVLYASQAQYGDVKDQPIPDRACRIMSHEVARVIELWLMSTAAAMQVSCLGS